MAVFPEAEKGTESVVAGMAKRVREKRTTPTRALSPHIWRVATYTCPDGVYSNGTAGGIPVGSMWARGWNSARCERRLSAGIRAGQVRLTFLRGRRRRVTLDASVPSEAGLGTCPPHVTITLTLRGQRQLGCRKAGMSGWPVSHYGFEA